MHDLRCGGTLGRKGLRKLAGETVDVARRLVARGLERGGIGRLVGQKPGQLVLARGELAFLGGEALLQLTNGRHAVGLRLGDLVRVEQTACELVKAR